MTDHVARRATLVTSTPTTLSSMRMSLGFDADVSLGSLIQYTKATKDYMVPSVWGPVDKKDDPYAPVANNPCCVVM